MTSASRKKEKYCTMLDASKDNFKSMSGYIKAIPRQGIVVIDNNVIPDTDSKQLRKTEKDSLDGVIELNTAFAEIIQNYASDRVIINKEARAEINVSLEAVTNEIRKTSGNASLYKRLIDSYANLGEKVNSPKRLQEAVEQETGAIYEAMRNIVRKLVLDFPKLKKAPGSGDGPDERIVAYAFAQAVAQDKKVYILSSDPDILNIASELYTILTAENVVGTDTITGNHLKLNNVEVVQFDEVKKLFQTAFNGKEDAPRTWAPREKGYSAKDQKNLCTYVQKNLINVEKELGNGKVLAALVEQEEKGAPAKASKSRARPAPEKPVEKGPSVLKALERIYARAGIDPEQLSVDDQDRIAEALGVCSDFRLVYEKCGLPVDSLDEEIRQLNEKALPYLIETKEAELKDINAQVIELRQSPEYLRASPDDSIRAREKELEQRFRAAQKELIAYEKKGASFDPARLGSGEAAVVEALKNQDAEVTPKGVWASNTQIADALGWTKMHTSRILRMLEDENLLEREKRGRYTFNLLTKDILKRFKKKN